MRRAAGAMATAAIAAAVPLAYPSFPAALRSSGTYPDNPPPATTGGFGEPTCGSCHLAGSVPDSSGSLVLEGLPASYVPGSRHLLSIVLARPGMELAGFELSARLVDGTDRGAQAGRLRVVDDRAAVTGAAGVQYAHQTAAGSLLSQPSRAAWRIEWLAPANGGRVVFHVAGNAANGDASSLGDHVYAIEVAIEPALEAPLD